MATKKTKEPKLILIAVAQLDCTSGDGVTAYAHACKSKKEAAEWLENDWLCPPKVLLKSSFH